MTVNKRWQTGRPLLNSLPGANAQYTDNAVANWLTAPWDNLFMKSHFHISDLARQLNPTTCDANWLDFLAGLTGFTGEYWDTLWPTPAKRKLIESAFALLWPSKGSIACISYVLTAFDILHIIQEGNSFIIGSSQVGDVLGTVAWDYKILVPTTYYGLPVIDLITKLDNLFGPCWCTKEIVYDSEFFRRLQVLGFEQALSPHLIAIDAANHTAINV